MARNVTLKPIVSRAAIGGHPLHPALIHFPVAALLGLIATDMAYLVSGDSFWARAGLWLAGVGAFGGAVSGTAGLVDLVTVPQIRRLVAAWSHAALAVMLLSLATLNWLLRFQNGSEAVIWPGGIYLSVLTGALIAVTAFLGGQLVYEYAIGINLGDAAEQRPQA